MQLEMQRSQNYFWGQRTASRLWRVPSTQRLECLPAPPWLQVACNRAATAAKLGRHEDALADAELAIELDPNYAKAFVRRAQAHQALKNYEAAIRDLEAAGGLDDSYPGERV